MSTINNRYEFTFLFDVENGNPNGDPDANNAPRVDIETGHGIVTDVCLKRKIRNFVEIAKGNEAGYNILIKNDRVLNEKFEDAYKSEELVKKDKVSIKPAQDFMCKNYYDVRAFGAVMSTGDYSCGTVRGPVQLNFARSADPIVAQNITITRQAKTSEATAAKGGDTEMGRKSIVPYALYRCEGYVSAMLAEKTTGFSEEDLELLWTSIINMFEHDHSAARGKMTLRKLFVFKHSSALGNAPSHILFDKITVKKADGVDVPRKFSDYTVSVDETMPSGVELICKL